MKARIFVLLLISTHFSVSAQTRKTENIFIITLDGFRWQELYTGADSLLIGNKDFVHNPPPTVEQKDSGQLYQNQVAKTAASFIGVAYKNRKPVGDVISSAIRK